MNSSNESRDAFLRKFFPVIAKRMRGDLQTSGGFASGNNDLKTRKKVTSVVRIVRKERRKLTELDEPKTIERECSDCGDGVDLSLSQAERMPPDATQCAFCFQQVLAEGFAALSNNGIILSSKAA
jgi:hypothetical protein